jgi:hypothetical protein
MVRLGPWAQVKKSHLRLAGRDLPIGQQIARWGSTPAGRTGPPIHLTAPLDLDDPGLILPRLRLSQPKQPESVLQPGRRVSFAQLDEEQRWVYWDWLARRERMAGVGYAYLYLYGLEAGLFGRQPATARAEIRRMFSECQDAAFQAQAAFDVALGAWLIRDAEAFAWSIEHLAWDGPYAGVMLWLQAKLRLEIAPRQILSLSPTCGYTPHTPPGSPLDECVQIGLAAFEENAGVPLLEHFALSLAGQEQALEIRLANPAARFSLPAVDLLVHEPFRQAVSRLAALADREAGAFQPSSPGPGGDDDSAPPGRKGREWYAAIEFGESASEQLGRVVAFAQKQAGYRKLLDEKRQLVHRVIFGRRELRQFWQLLDMVRTWKSTRVYVNGEERDPAHVWPYRPLE